MKKLSLFLIFVLVCHILFAAWNGSNQAGKDEQERITISRDTKFPEALRAIESLSMFYEGKKIVNLSSYSEPIGLPIKQLFWRDALELIVKFNNRSLKDTPGVVTIADQEIIGGKDGEVISPDTKQVRISATFFKADQSFSKNMGIDWSSFINGKVSGSVDFKGASAVTDDLLSASAGYRYQTGNYTIDVNALFKILEAHQHGDLLARPNTTVLSGKEGFIQVGENFSLKTIDDDGNTTDEFFETGIIMRVTPSIIQRGDQTAVHLKADVENSTATPGEITTIISTNKSTTEVLLFDGEETLIAGLYDTDETIVRKGIPFLKDLPWWVFGIRYLTGFNQTQRSVGEMIIVLKVEILKSLEDRLAEKISTENKILEMRRQNQASSEMFDRNKPFSNQDGTNELKTPKAKKNMTDNSVPEKSGEYHE